MKRNFFSDTSQTDFRPKRRKVTLSFRTPQIKKKWAETYLKELSITNQNTFTSLTEFLDVDSTEGQVTLFPHIILDLFFLKPSLFGKAFSGKFVQRHHCTKKVYDKLYVKDAALQNRLEVLATD